MKLIASLFLLVTAAVLVQQSDANGRCPNPALLSTTSADQQPASSGLIGVPGPLRKCEDGPVTKIFTLKNEFYWPPIYRGSCDGLKCKDPPCYARKAVWRSRCVLVYRLIGGYWRKIGFQTRRYIDHLQCSCKNCGDIRDQRTCATTQPCPNSRYKYSFCYWNLFRRNCDCCVPFTCRKPLVFSRTTCSCVCPITSCPSGRIFNSRTCTCDCPEGTKDFKGKCIGDCNKISPPICRYITCIDNTNFNCALKVINKKTTCVCPSCESASPLLCTKTKCLEHHNKPTCVFDRHAKKCRCPNCYDRTDRNTCVQTYCGAHNNLKCRYTAHRNVCFCPF